MCRYVKEAGSTVGEAWIVRDTSDHSGTTKTACWRVQGGSTRTLEK